MLKTQRRSTYDRRQRRLINEYAAMAEIGRIISSSIKIDEIYEAFAEQVRALIPFSQMEITVIDRDRDQDEVAFSTGLSASQNGFGWPTPLEGSVTGEITSHRTGLIIQGMETEEVASKYPCLGPTFHSGIRSCLAVPLITRGEAIGGLLLASTEATAFTAQDMNMAQRVGNQIAGAIANAQLYAERLRAEERIRETSRLASLGELAAGVAHEINNPLTAIIGNSELLIDEELPPPTKHRIRRINAQAQRCARIVNSLLAFARREKPEKRYVDVRTVLERSLELKAHEFRVNNIRVTREWAEDVPFTMADEHQLAQVIVNILTNAEHAITRANGGGNITVSAGRSGKNIKVSVTDDGPGIPPDILTRIFEPFFTTKDVGEGTGLGLSTSYGIVRQHGGKIWAESVPGLGAAFYNRASYCGRPRSTDGRVSIPGQDNRTRGAKAVGEWRDRHQIGPHRSAASR